MKPKILLPLLMAALAATAFLACGGNDDTPADDDNANNQTDTPFEICLDADNPLFARVTTDENMIHFYADKDDEGYPTLLREVVYETIEGEVCDITYDDQERPVLMIAPNGVKFILDWQSDTYAALTAIDPTSGGQINTYVDLEEDIGDTELPETASRTFPPRSGNLQMRMESVEQNHVSTSLSSSRSEISSGSIPVKMKLRNCNLPIDAICYVDVLGDYEWSSLAYKKTLGRFYGERVAEGEYEVHIPSTFFSDYQGYYDLGKSGEKIARFMHKVCDGNAIVGANLLGIIGAQIRKIPHPAAQVIGWGAVGIQHSVNAYCTFVDPFLEDFCKDMQVQAVDYSTNVILVPCVQALPSDIWGQPVGVDLSTGKIDDIEISWGGDPEITSFTLDPPVPTADYIATATIYCVPRGSVITLTVSGSDDYEDSITETVTGDERHHTVSLIVPEAYGGIRDRCEIVITTPDGKKVSKVATLEFPYE